MEGYLRSQVPGYDKLPDPAKLGLLDMVYNLGPGRLFSQFPRLLAAVEAGHWDQAAAMSSRRGPAPVRNEWTRQQFLAAAKQIAIQAEAEIEAIAVSAWLPGLVGLAAALLAVWAARSANSRSGQ
jgi:hypothetical protein